MIPSSEHKVLTGTTTQYSMEEEHQQNVLDYFDEELTILFSLDDAKIKSLIDAINKFGVNLSVVKIGQVTGLDTSDGTSGQIRGMLSNIIHQYYNHREQFDDDLQNTELQKENVPKIKEFLQKLNNDAIVGLNTRFETNRALGEYNLDSISSEVFLKEISDEKNNFLGYVPIMRVSFEINDSDNEIVETKKFDIELDKLTALIGSFESMRKDFVISATRYKNKLGDALILPQDE